MKVIPEMWRIWWRLFQKRDLLIRSFKKRDVSDEGYSRNVTYLRRSFQKREVSDEGYFRDVMYLMNVIPETWRIWWRFFQKRDVSDEGYSRNVTDEGY